MTLWICEEGGERDDSKTTLNDNFSLHNHRHSNSTPVPIIGNFPLIAYEENPKILKTI